LTFAGVMNDLTFLADQRRNKNFEHTHRQLIERAVALMGEGRGEMLSVATLAREAGMNRSTVYYHFESREALVDEVRQWVGRRLGDILLGHGDMEKRVELAMLFVLEHPVVVDIWGMDLARGGGLAQNFPHWDLLLKQLEGGLRGGDGAQEDAPLWGVVMLSIALAAPRLYPLAVRPKEDRAKIAQRFARAYGRLRGRLQPKA